MAKNYKSNLAPKLNTKKFVRERSYDVIWVKRALWSRKNDIAHEIKQITSQCNHLLNQKLLVSALHGA